MKCYSSEFGRDYSTYSFGYTNYAVREEGERVSQLLAHGYLPYTGNAQLVPHSYYMARSLRVRTFPFDKSSENRRVLRKFKAFSFELKRIDATAFDWTESQLSFCLRYANERFSTSFPPSRISRILSHSHLSSILVIRHAAKIVAIVLLSTEAEAWHYWFSFLSLTHFEGLPFGKWVMTQCLQLAEEASVPFVYLGTCYGSHSLYKVRDFKNISFFNGTHWVTDANLLKKLCKMDDTSGRIDLIKSQPQYYADLFTH